LHKWTLTFINRVLPFISQLTGHHANGACLPGANGKRQTWAAYLPDEHLTKILFIPVGFKLWFIFCFIKLLFLTVCATNIKMKLSGSIKFLMTYSEAVLKYYHPSVDICH
jgi:hypothetical protein